MLVVGVLTIVLAGFSLWPTTGQRDAAHATEQCGADDADRWSFTTYSGGTVTPCLSKVTLNLTLTRAALQNSFKVDKIRIPSSSLTVKYADGSTESGLVHLTFESFQILSRAVMKTSGGKGYTLSMTPDSTSVIGGDGIDTDLVVTASSTFTVRFLGVCTTFTASQLASLNWLIQGSDWDGCGMNLDIRYLTTYRPGGGTTTGSIQLPNTDIKVSQ